MTRERLKIGGRTEASKRRPAGLPRGVEPPLNLLGADARQIDRRDVNLRWLCASALTGITGALLIGAAIHVSLQGEVSLASVSDRPAPPPRLQGPLSEEPGVASAQKGDRLVRTLMIASAKQSFRTPVTVRLGDREIIKVRPFVRIASNLSMSTGVFASDIPRFDPMKFVSDEPQERAPDPGAADAPGAEVTVVKRDLGELAIEPSAPALSDEDVTAQVEFSDGNLKVNGKPLGGLGK